MKSKSKPHKIKRNKKHPERMYHDVLSGWVTDSSGKSSEEIAISLPHHCQTEKQ